MTGPQGPPGKRIGPAPTPGRPDTETATTQDDESILPVAGDNWAPRHQACRTHLRGHFCARDIETRRRVARLLDEILADLYPAGWDR